MGTLYECLKEARLEKYYPTFRVNGITRSEALARLGPEDCDAIGITSSDDRRRLTELINIIKSVHDDEPAYLSPATVRSNAQQIRQSPRKRNRSPAVSALEMQGRGLSATNDVRVRENRPQQRGSHIAAVELLDLSSSSEQDSDESEHSDYEPATKHINAATPSPPAIRKTAVSRVKQKGYNYGVPNSVSSSVSKSRTRASTSGRIIGGDEKIKVCVRKRPLNRKEVKSGEVDIAIAESTTTLTVNEPKAAVDLTAYTLQHEFIFDEVFDEKCSNEDVYIRAARPLISCIFDGGSATCFAYGQTGAGKTHTMLGSREVPGLYLLAAQDIFSIIQDGKYGSGIRVWISYFEIYCGQLFDLLNKRNRLHAREDGSHRVCIAGLTETEAKDVKSLLQILEYGNSVRSKGATGVNPDSSRSHAVLQLEIRNTEDKRLGRISFIDLAGSERASDVTDTDRQTRMEGAEINQSLLALKECIRSIDQESKHKPFRQSKLTHILKDSFVGNSRTCMIANISPIQSSCEHTLNTLRYADRVKELRRETTPGGSTRSSVPGHILMNIPATAPSVFQPSNILCSSTPIRPRTTRHTASRGSSQDLLLDPNESPIKGHGVKRKTATKSATSGVTKPQIRQPSASVASRINVIRHTAPTFVPPAPAAASEPSPSESDHTDSDSCNVTGKQNIPKIESKAVVVKSTDTDNDFPTTDFNNEEEMNDLNRTGKKSEAVGGVSSVHTTASRVTPTSVIEVKLSTSGHPLPIIDDDEGAHTNASQSGVVQRSGKSALVLRQKMYSEATRSASTSPKEGSRNQLNKNTSTNAFRQVNSASSQINNNTPRVSESSPQHHGNVVPPSFMSSESFEDDLLFEGVDPPFSSSHKTPRTPRTPSTGDITSPGLGLSRGSNGPLKLPQDPSLNPVIPAVVTAKSSDLTTFSQRSPGRFARHYEPDPPPPPFPLAFVNPTESRPRILRTPPLLQNDMSNVPHSQVLLGAEGGVTPLGGEIIPPPLENNYLVSDRPDIPDKGENFRTFSTGYLSNRNEYKGKNATVIPEPKEKTPPMKQQNQVFPYFKRNEQVEEERLSPALGDGLLDTNDWYNTPGNFDFHINSSVQKSTTDLPLRSNRAETNYGNSEINNLQATDSQQKSANASVSDSKFDPNLPEFLPIQKRANNEEKVTLQKKDVASRLRSVFFKDSPDQLKSGKQSGHVSVKSDNSTTETNDSGIVASSASDSKTSVSNNTRSILQNLLPFSHGISTNGKNDNPHQMGDNSNMNSKKNNLTTDGNRHYEFPSSNEETLEKDPQVKEKNGNSVITTEKINMGSAFSPIHPQPLTSNRSTKSNIGAFSKNVLQTKVSSNSSSSDHMTGRQTSSDSVLQSEKRQRLIGSHEDQLANVTSMCKQEMKLLLSAKAGHKTFDEYITKVSHLLSHKMSAIQLLQEEIENYFSAQTNNI